MLNSTNVHNVCTPNLHFTSQLNLYISACFYKSIFFACKFLSQLYCDFQIYIGQTFQKLGTCSNFYEHYQRKLLISCFAHWLLNNNDNYHEMGILTLNSPTLVNELLLYSLNTEIRVEIYTSTSLLYQVSSKIIGN